jgi:hypothetical protein
VVYVIGDYERDGNAGVDQHVRPTRHSASAGRHRGGRAPVRR